MISGYNVVITKSAQIDISEIYDYINVNLKSPQNANDVLESIQNEILSLEKVPKRGRIFQSEPWKTRELRLINIKNWTIFYFVDDEKMVVTIIKIAYSRRNFDELFDSFI